MLAEIILLRKMPIKLNTLTYQVPVSMEGKINIGCFVFVLFKSQKMMGIVVDLKPRMIATMFKLKNILDIIPELKLTTKQLTLINWLSGYYARPIAKIIQTFIPTRFSLVEKKTKKENVNKINLLNIDEIIKKQKLEKSKEYLFIYQTEEEKQKFYYQIIFPVLNNNQSVLLISPNKTNFKKLKKFFLNIFPETFFLSNDSKNFPILNSWSKINKCSRSLVVGRRLSVLAPFNNLGLIIVDEENSESYQEFSKKFRYNTHLIIEQLFKQYNSTLVYSSYTPSLPLFYRYHQKKVNLINNSPLINFCQPMIVNMKQSSLEDPNLKISDQLWKQILLTLNNKQKIILFNDSNASFKRIYCADCQYLFICADCHSPYSFHRYPTPHLKCHNCSNQTIEEVICPKCHGTKLRHSQSGIEEIYQILKKKIPQVKIEILTNKKADPATDIYLGNQNIFSKSIWQENLGLLAILSSDIYFYLPNYDTIEKLYLLIKKIQYQINSLKPQPLFYWQTNFFDHYLIQSFVQNKSLLFYQTELNNRQKLKYPPFSQIIIFNHKNFDFSLGKKTVDDFYQQLKKIKTDEFIIYPLKYQFNHQEKKNIWTITVKIFKNNEIKNKIFSKISTDFWAVDII